MPPVQTNLIWTTYLVALAVVFVLAATFVFLYRARRDGAASVTAVSILTSTALLATVLLLPVDVALVASTNDPAEGRRRDWATPDEVGKILYTLKVVYYTLYSLDAVLCLLVVPFTYFWYEEHDPDGEEDGTQTALSRVGGACKYTLFFLALVVILFLVGFFIPNARKIKEGKHLDLDYFKKLLEENHGERALTFALGLLITIGTFLYVIYTATGLALLPVALIKSAPAISAPSLAASTAAELEQNRERQRQLDARNEGRPGGLDARDRRELEGLLRDERTLVRRERLAAEARGEGRGLLVRAWHKLEAVLRPIKLLGGLALLALSLLVFASMLVTGIDKAKNSACGARCGYILGATHLFQPLNALLLVASRAFPADYVLLLLLVLHLFASSVAGLAAVGIRALWAVVFRVRRGRTSPQALLLATLLLALVGLAIDYAVVTMVAPRYATFGPQAYCDRAPRHPGEQPDCAADRGAIRPCAETATNEAAQLVCTPSVASTFINRMTANFPFFGVVDFWAQFAFLGVFLLVFLVTLFRTPKLDVAGLDADLEDDEEEGLLASTGRRFNATWQDITGRSRKRVARYGATDQGDEEARDGADAA